MPFTCRKGRPGILLVFTASNPGLLRIEAWIRGYHRGSEKGCGLITPTQINTDTTPFPLKKGVVFSLAQDFIHRRFLEDFRFHA